MKPQRQNEVIARTLGWEDLAPGDPHPVNWRFSFRPPKIGEGIGGVIASDPLWPSCNYVGDLNSMHDAEKTLTEAQRIEYLNTLANRWPFREDHFAYGFIAAITATAAQRAESFLRTLGLWEEEDKS